MRKSADSENINWNRAGIVHAVGVDDLPAAWDSQNRQQDRGASQAVPSALASAGSSPM